jgi:hypothetical protein
VQTFSKVINLFLSKEQNSGEAYFGDKVIPLILPKGNIFSSNIVIEAISLIFSSNLRVPLHQKEHFLILEGHFLFE